MTKKLIHILLSGLLWLQASLVFAQSDDQKSAQSPMNEPAYSINELALPSEVKNIGKVGGAIYYSPSVKGKVLIPVHVWGEIQRGGLHFFPVDTSLINGISLAGGAASSGVLDRVRVMRLEGQEVKSEFFDLEEGGDAEAYKYKLKPGDTIFIPKSNFYENRAYYTGLIGVIATVLSSILLYRQVKKSQ